MEEIDSMIEFGNSTEIIAGGVQQDQRSVHEQKLSSRAEAPSELET
jgi:hypothetical protein